MKKLFIILLMPIIFVSSTAGFVAQPAAAVDVISPACNNPNATERPAICNDNHTGSDDNNPLFGPDGVLTKGVQILTIIVGIAAVIVIIVSAINFVSSGGNAENVAKARRGLIFAVVGLIIAVMAQLIVSFVLSKV